VWEHPDSGLGAHVGLVLKPIQTLKEYFWSHIYCAHPSVTRLKIVWASCTVSNRESQYPRRDSLLLDTAQEGPSINLAQIRPKLNAIHMTEKIFEHFYLFLGLNPSVPMHLQPRPFWKQLFLDFCKLSVSTRVPGLGQITWWIMDKKMGHSGKKIAQKSRNSCWVNGRSCGFTRTADTEHNFLQS